MCTKAPTSEANLAVSEFSGLRRRKNGDKAAQAMADIDFQPFDERHRAGCSNVLTRLSSWFGLEESNRAYIAALGRLPTRVAIEDSAIVGFIALEEHNLLSVEIHVMAVDPARHRQGIGKRLVAWAVDRCLENGVRWLHVKTLGPSMPDAGYAKTRAFYAACGFEPLFETQELWGPENPALILVRRLAEGLSPTP